MISAVNSFVVAARWPAHVSGDGPAEATHCSLKISVAGKNATAFVRENGTEEDHLEIPAYYLAEWIAENWWPLLWEPRKTEDWESDDPDFRFRHSILSAQHGFVLPNITITPTGTKISIYTGARKAEHADARFIQSADAVVDRNIVEQQLRTFVEETVRKIEKFSTPLHRAWTLIRESPPEDEKFCRLLGALGLSPFEKHENIERALDVAAAVLSEEQLMDLCLTASPENFVLSTSIASSVSTFIRKAPQVDLSVLNSLTIPADVPATGAFRTGYRAARALRQSLNVEERDINGARFIFERLKLEPAIRIENGVQSESPVIGITRKSGDEGRLALVSTNRSSRRFSGARAAYLFWTSTESQSRLITAAATRDQQASRAFAAELLVPQAYVRSQASSGKLGRSRIQEIAENANVAVDVVKHQATNNGIRIV